MCISLKEENKKKETYMYTHSRVHAPHAHTHTEREDYRTIRKIREFLELIIDMLKKIFRILIVPKRKRILSIRWILCQFISDYTR